ncbi:MAG: UbiA family prenyltransferase [Bdellovibrio sp.]|nr:UbiA family prenyltransferase [Bdellovibrio sp.]
MSSASRFVTVKKFDRDFSKYLWGRTGNDTRAIPVRSLNVGLDDELVTFELKPKSEISQPGFFLFWTTAIKLRSYILFLFPLFYVVSKNFLLERFRDPVALAFALVAMMFIYAGLNIRNDIADHISGFDRVNIPTSLKPILLGWTTASRMSKVSWLLLIIGIVLAIPVVLLEPDEIKVLSVVVVLIVLGQFFKKNSYKEKISGEVILFLLIGMGVTSGFQEALGADIDRETLALGFFWGAAVLFLVHVNNFSHLLTSTQAGIKNTMTNLGFDRAKNFLMIWWGACLVIWFFFHWFYASSYLTWLSTLVLTFWSIPLFIKLSQIRSPLGSDLLKIRESAHKTFLIMVAIFFVENAWYIGTKLNWMP